MAWTKVHFQGGGGLEYTVDEPLDFAALLKAESEVFTVSGDDGARYVIPVRNVVMIELRD